MSYEQAKSMAEEVTRQWCEARKRKPEFTKLSKWKCFTQRIVSDML